MRRLRIYGLIVLTVCLASCIKIDTPPSLGIVVIDQYNNPVSEALVAIFDSQEEWGMKENPVQSWKMTDINGIVKFVNLKEANYFIFAEKNNLNNLKNEIGTTSALVINHERIIRIHID